jgi:hypothetical protein
MRAFIVEFEDYPAYSIRTNEKGPTDIEFIQEVDISMDDFKKYILIQRIYHSMQRELREIYEQSGGV